VEIHLTFAYAIPTYSYNLGQRIKNEFWHVFVFLYQQV
jgi:hypothetical protein